MRDRIRRRVKIRVKVTETVKAGLTDIREGEGYYNIEIKVEVSSEG